MKNFLVLAVLGLASMGSAANAAIMTATPGPAPNVYSIYLAGETTTFNGVDFKVTPDNGLLFQNLNGGLVSGAPRGPGDSFTYRNRAIDLDPNDLDNPGIGKGWTLIAPTVTTSQVSFAGGPLGTNINTAGEPGGRLFLANIMVAPGQTAHAMITLVNGVQTVFQQTLYIPEPATVGMASMGLLGLIALRRRK